MGVVYLIIIGAAAGFLATRLMRIEAGVVQTVLIGIAGALIGAVVIRVLLMVTGLLGGLIGAVLGSLLLIWLYQMYLGRKKAARALRFPLLTTPAQGHISTDQTRV